MSTIKKPLPRPKQQRCEICQRNFSLLLQQHQCKRCKRAVCFDCGKFKAIIVDYDLKTQHRCCIICKEEQLAIQDIISKEQLSFNKNSLITNQWLRYSLDNVREQDLIDEYYAILGQSKNNLPPSAAEELKSIPVILNQIRNQYNYSMKEFDYYLTKDLMDNMSAIFLQSVLQCLLYKNPNIQINQNLVQMTYFLLCFHSSPLVFHFINCFREEISLGRFLDQNDSIKDYEIDFLLEIGKKNYLIEPTDLLYFRKYLEKHAEKMLSNTFFNFVNVQCLIFIYDHVLKFRDYFELEKIATLIGSLYLNDFKQKGLDDEYFTNQIIKNTKPSVLKEYLSKEDRIRLNDKRQTYSKSEDIFLLQFQQKLDHQNETKQILYLLDDCLLKKQPLNNHHKQLISQLNQKQQQIINDLLKINYNKPKEQDESQLYHKIETHSNSSTQIKFDKSELVD
ncbi:unnamed protein product (macronuclear) [Paramecium tetraurelia]|uniref:FYVE-type domain-containing protein n=1 Tax=Paramecium tetraurelia TaxID=5888 RepID=A0BXB7_PARTE|nr:uncharacterized protein GSPATT00033037001 [Paramecium tetraurelia]CAK63184.1 unnamed protein product [Paramecium tetraurelia]|eukprot:XP_001430582.1 hypothetical protein (macronuclear) [Paramecium tetraurelia strain d4-2]